MATAALDGYLSGMTDRQRELADRFLELYYNARQSNLTWGNTRWLGVKTLRCPLDLWLYQEIIFECKPDLIVETGTAHGGGALFLACMCELVANGQVVSIDIEHRAALPTHRRLTYLNGSSAAGDIVQQVQARAARGRQTLVILDSDHAMPHVLAELRAYAPLVKKGGYLIVEDTIVNGHPLRPDFGPGPLEALEQFLAENFDFAIDRSKEKFLLSFNRSGYLKRIR